MNIGIAGYITQHGGTYLSELFKEAIPNSIYVINPSRGMPPIDTIVKIIESNNINVLLSIETHAKSSLGLDNLRYLKDHYNVKLIEIPMIDCCPISWVTGNVYSIFDSILCLSEYCYNIFSKYYSNTHLLRLGIKDQFLPITNNANITFLHPSGWGGKKGVYRKSTLECLTAFNQLLSIRTDVKLILTSQWSYKEFSKFYGKKVSDLDTLLESPNITGIFKDLDRAAFLNLYNSTDILLYPSKKEGVGMGVFEALSRGIPCILTNMHPYNEFITHGLNSWLCEVVKTTSIKNIFIPLCYPSINSIIDILSNLDKNDILKMREQIRETILDYFNWEKFVDNLNNLVGGVN